MSEAHMTAVLGGFGATHPDAVSGIIFAAYFPTTNYPIMIAAHHTALPQPNSKRARMRASCASLHHANL
jgi:hypothetical protein